MQATFIFLIAQLFWRWVTAESPDIDCLDGIRTAIAGITFDGTDPEDYWGNICTNNLSVTSMWASTKVYCTDRERIAGEDMLAGYCTEYGLVTLIPYADILPLLSDQYVNTLPLVEFDDIGAAVVWNHSVLLSKELYTASKRTVSVFSRSYLLDSRYGWGVYGFWGSLLVLGMVTRLTSHIVTSRRLSAPVDVEGREASPTSKSSFGLFTSACHWFQTNFIIPAAFGTHHQRLYYWCTIPTRMETLVVMAFWVLNVILCAVTYDIFWPNLYYTNASQYWRYIADRTGIMSYANLPILWMFSGRNNIFLWLTGWSFSTFNIFHRHIARIATVQAIIHSICYSALEADYYAESWKEQYWYMGAMATITMSLLLAFSSVWLRKRFYELFLLIHIALSIITIIGLFYHTKIFDGEYDPYLWPLVAIWVFDRVARFVRLAYCNLHLKLSDKIIGTKTHVHYDKEADLIRLEVTPGTKILKARAGQHYYLYQPLKWKGWENHPFTLAGWKSSNQPSYGTRPALSHIVAPDVHYDLKGKDKEVQVAALDTPTSSSGPSSEDASIASVHENPASEQQLIHTSTKSSTDTLVFFVRPYSSWTLRLRDECIKSPTSTVDSQVLLEGPYGEHSPVHSYENVVFIVGGSGISGAVPYLQEYMLATRLNSDQVPSQEESFEGRKINTRTKRIMLIWATKQSAMVRSLCDTELKPFIGHPAIETHFYVTSRRESSATIERDNAEKSHSLASGVSLEIAYGRPAIREKVLGFIGDVGSAGKAGGQVAILTCGPAGMADEARAAVHTAMKQGRRGVGYFEEAFGW